MSRSISLAVTLIALAVSASVLSACGGIPGNAVVQVGDTPITRAAFDHWMAAAAAQPTAPGQRAERAVVPDPPNFTACIAHLEAVQPKPAKGQKPPSKVVLKSQCQQQYEALKKQTLGFLITSAWVLGEADEQGVKVSDDEVKKEFNRIVKERFPKSGEFQRFIASSGQTVSDLLLRVKLQLVSQKIERKISDNAGRVSTAQAQSYYNSHRSSFGNPEKRNLLIILTRTEAQAKKAKSEIQGGKSFTAVAKKVSIDPTSKAAGGVLNEVSKGQEEKSLDEAVFAAKLNVLSGPIKTPFGFYLFKVTKKTAATQQTFAQVQAQIKQQLLAEHQQKALARFVRDFRKRWEGKTDCRPEYMVEDCKGFRKSRTAATPATTSTAPTTTVRTATTPATTSTGAKKR